jgi:hypothetical protein
LTVTAVLTLHVPPSKCRHLSVNPVALTLATVGMQLFGETRVAGSRTASVTITEEVEKAVVNVAEA